MRWLIVAMLALAPACTPSEAPPSTRYGRENVGFDVTRDAAVNGQYIASGTYVEGQGVDPDDVKWRILLNGMEAVRKDGFTYVVRGYKSAGDYPSAARPVVGLIDQINGALAKRKA